MTSIAVSVELVDAALGAARWREVDVAEVPLTAIASAAGISRSTLLRRLGGSRAALDDAVRAAGVDPGGRPPVRERAVEAAAELVSEHGLGAVTLDAVARAAGCSVPSLHQVFEGRDGLLTAVFERYGPVVDLEAVAADPPAEVADTVRAVYRVLLTTFTRQPRVLPALLGDLFSRPHGPASRLLATQAPRIFGSLGGLLSTEVGAGRLRPMPLPLLIQLLVGPLAVHMLFRPVLESGLDTDLPDLDEVAETFADAFLRAAATEQHR